MAGTIPRGRWVWHELLTTDTEAAAAFYKKIVGWGLVPFAPSYRMWTLDGTPVGGLMVLPEDAKRMGAPPHWLAYLSAPDVDATVRQAAALGAKVYREPSDVPNVGRYAVLADPQGAVFAVYRTSGPWVEPPTTPQRGRFSWHELVTTDYRAALDFYLALFGWDRTDAMDMGPAGVYQMYGWGGKSMGGIYNRPPDTKAPPHWLCYAHVASADSAAEAVKRSGGKVMNGPMEVPGGDRIAMCMDPQGAAFAVHSTKTAVMAKPAAPKAKAAKSKPKAARSRAKRARKPARAKARRAKAKRARKPARAKRRTRRR